MTPEALMRTVEDFLAGARDAVVLDEGAVLFDLAQAKYSVSGERNKCLLHLWSEERNLVRRVLDVEVEARGAATGGAALGANPSQQAGDLPRSATGGLRLRTGRAVGLPAELARDAGAAVFHL